MEPNDINKLDFSFQDRVIAWVDVLGVKDNKLLETEKFIKTVVTSTVSTKFFQKGSEDKYKVINNLHPKSQISYSKVEFTNFSDSFVFSIPSNSDGKNIAELVDYVSRLQSLLFQFQDSPILTRGVICIGNLLHNEKFCSGLGLEKAYKIESSLICYPRIVVLDDVINLLVKHKIEIDNNSIIKDVDGLSFINYLTGFTSAMWCPDENNNNFVSARIFHDDGSFKRNFENQKNYWETRIFSAKEDALKNIDKNSLEYIKVLQKWSWIEYHFKNLLRSIVY